VTKLFPNKLYEIEPGLFVPRNKEITELSYPEDAHDILSDIEDTSFWFKYRNQSIAQVISKIPPNGKIYDVGGGNGYVSLYLKKQGFDMILIEPGIHGAKNALKRGLNPVICATLQQTGFEHGTLPAIAIFDVLEHIEDDISFLKEFYNYLENEGKLYLTVPAYNFLWSSVDDESGHFRRYNTKQLKQTLSKAGFQVEYSTYFFSFLPIPIYLFRKIPSILGIKRKDIEKEAEKEHKAGVFSKLIDWYMQWELKKIKRSSIKFGGSCLVVAKKIKM
jgi:SAM-dependent methyltransferase